MLRRKNKLATQAGTSGLKELTSGEPINNPFDAHNQRMDLHHDCTLKGADVAFVDFLGVEQFDWIPNIRLVNLVNKLKHKEKRSSQILNYFWKRGKRVKHSTCFRYYLICV